MTTMRNPTIDGLPIEILTYIISLVESVNLYQEEYIDISPNGEPYFVKKKTTSLRDGSMSMIFRYKMRGFLHSTGIKLLPANLSRLSMVSTSFNKSCMPLWEPIYILHFRKGIPFKRNHSPEFYRKKYLAYVKQYYSAIRDKSINELSLSDKMIHIKQNNSSIYLRYIQEAVEKKTIDNPKKIYYVKDILICSDFEITETITLPLRIDRIILSRQKSVFEIEYYTTKSNSLKKKIESVEKVIIGF